MYELQQLFLQPSANLIGLQEIYDRALNGKRSQRIALISIELGYLLQQICILLLVIYFTTRIDHFDVFWQCPGRGNWAITYSMIFICLVLGIVRPFVDSSFVQPREILHIRPLPSAISVGVCEDCSLFRVPPPGRRTSLFSRIISFSRRQFTLFRRVYCLSLAYNP